MRLPTSPDPPDARGSCHRRRGAVRDRIASEPGGDSHRDEAATESVGHSEQGQAAEITAAERLGNTAEEGGEERVLGIDFESPLLVGAAVVVSVLLAGVLWPRPDRRLLVVITIAAGAFALLDTAEVVHQLNADRTGLASLAALIAVLHAAAATLALHQATTTGPDGRRTSNPVTDPKAVVQHRVDDVIHAGNLDATWGQRPIAVTFGRLIDYRR
ncbi:MAG: hypothetical protein ACRD2C_15175 [Acidimicrobiales bacterium]